MRSTHVRLTWAWQVLYSSRIKQCFHSTLQGCVCNQARALTHAVCRYGLELVLLTTPTTPQQRASIIAQRTQGFLYLVSVTGLCSPPAHGPRHCHCSHLQCGPAAMLNLMAPILQDAAISDLAANLWTRLMTFSCTLVAMLDAAGSKSPMSVHRCDRLKGLDGGQGAGPHTAAAGGH